MFSPKSKVNHIFLITADCKWGAWKKGTCSKVCPGKRHDTREQLQGSMYGGKTCEQVDPNNGHERIVQCCESCPGKKCPKGIGIKCVSYYAKTWF